MKNQSSVAVGWREFAAIMLARLSLLWLIATVLQLLPSEQPVFFLFVAMVFIAVVPASLWLRRRLDSIQISPLLFFADLLFVSIMVWVSGELHGSLVLLYPLVILSAGVIELPRTIAEISVLGMLFYALLLAFGFRGRIEGDDSEMAWELLSFAVFALVSIGISRRLALVERLEQMTRDALEIMLRGFSIPLVVLNRSGTILMANDGACTLLQQREGWLVGQLFTGLQTVGRLPLPEGFGMSAYFLRPNAEPVAVAYHMSTLSLPSSIAFPGETGEGDVRDIVPTVLQDLSPAIAMQQRINVIEKITEATHLAGEMAHEIRTPLTAISASVEMLKQYEESSSSADWKPNSLMQKNRAELYDHIMNSSQRMDRVIQHFCDFAEFSPKDLISIIKLDSIGENEGYIGQIQSKPRGLCNGQNSDSGR